MWKRICHACLGVFLGCGQDGGSGGSQPAENAALEPLQLQLGSGQTAHVPLAEGDPVELVSGPQGGWHLNLTVRGCGQAPAGLVLRYVVTTAGLDTPLTEPTTATLTARNTLAGTEGCFVRVGDRAVFTVASPAEVVGRTVVVTLEATRGGELEARGQVSVNVVDLVAALKDLRPRAQRSHRAGPGQSRGRARTARAMSRNGNGRGTGTRRAAAPVPRWNPPPHP